MRRLGELVDEQLHLNLESRRRFCIRTGTNEGTLAAFVRGNRSPTRATIRSISGGLGWSWNQVEKALPGDLDPQAISLSDVKPPPASDPLPSPSVTDLSDAELLMEVTRRIAARNSTIRELKDKLAADSGATEA